MSDKPKFPVADARAVAEDIKGQLESACERIEIAGSIRRARAFVGDIELVFIPKMVPVNHDLFSDQSTLDDAAADRIEAMLAWGHIQKRPNIRGSFTWGMKNKLAIHVKTGIPIDFFSTTLENWPVTMVIRTGPKELNLHLITEAAKRGLKLHAYGVLERIKTGEKIVPASEEELFAYCGVAYANPKDRR